MKKTYVLLLAGIISLTNFASCSKDDDENTDPDKDEQELIVGTWQYVSITSDKPYHWDNHDRTPVGTDGFVYNECARGDRRTLNKGTNANQGSAIYYYNCYKQNKTGSWVFQNDVLTLWWNEDDKTHYIFEDVTKTTLKLSEEKYLLDDKGEIKDTVHIVHMLERKDE